MSDYDIKVTVVRDKDYTVEVVRELTIGEMDMPDSWVSDLSFAEIAQGLLEQWPKFEGCTEWHIGMAGSLYRIALT